MTQENKKTKNKKTTQQKIKTDNEKVDVVEIVEKVVETEPVQEIIPVQETIDEIVEKVVEVEPVQETVLNVYSKLRRGDLCSIKGKSGDFIFIHRAGNTNAVLQNIKTQENISTSLKDVKKK